MWRLSGKRDEELGDGEIDLRALSNTGERGHAQTVVLQSSRGKVATIQLHVDLPKVCACVFVYLSDNLCEHMYCGCCLDVLQRKGVSSFSVFVSVSLCLRFIICFDIN